MALKIWLNGSMKKIDTNLHKPVIFLNGTKYKLDKAYTFVNGVKQQIWGESGVQIDYISSTGSFGGGYPFAVGENWLNCYYNNNIYRFDISNLSSPTLTQSVAWGALVRYNNYQTTANNSVFEGYGNRTNYKYSVDNSTGAMLVDSSLVFTPTTVAGTDIYNYICATNNNFIDAYGDLYSTSPVVMYKYDFYWNNVRKYEQSTSLITSYFQNGNDTFVGRQGLSSYIFSDSGKTAVGGNVLFSKYAVSGSISFGPDQLFTDSSYVYSGTSSYISKKPISDLTQEITYSTASGTKPYLLGKIGSYIYCLVIPTTNITPDSVVKLVLLNESDLSVAFEKVLPNDPFNEDSGYPYFWTKVDSYNRKGAWTIPQVSQTGFLAFGRYDNSTLGLRIARFSAIF